MKKLLPSILFLLTFLTAACQTKPSTANLTPIAWTLRVDGFGPTLTVGNTLVGFSGDVGEQWSVVAVDLPTHTVAWRDPIEQNFLGIGNELLAGDSENVFALIPGEGLRIYSTDTGKLATLALPDEVMDVAFGAGPRLFGDKLFITNDNKLYAYDVSAPDRPTLLWQQVFETRLWALNLDDEGKQLYVGVAKYQGKSNLQAVDPEDGHVVWTADTTYTDLQTFAQAPTAISVEAGRVIAAVETSVQAFDETTGERLYVSELLETCPDGPGTVTSLELGEGKVFVSPSSGTCVYGINLADGTLAWTHSARRDEDTSFTYGGRPVYVNGVVYASNSALWALDAKTGEVLSLAGKRDNDATNTYLHYVNGEVLVWGDDLTAYKPLR